MLFLGFTPVTQAGTGWIDAHFHIVGDIGETQDFEAAGEKTLRIMDKHPNLYCDIRATFKRNDPMRHPVRGINNGWLEAVKAFPDRFLMGTDSFVITPGYTGPKGPRIFSGRSWIQREGANEVLSNMDDGLSSKIGRENTIRVDNLH